MIRWTFYFNKECIFSDVITDEEDKRIADTISDEPNGILCLKGNKGIDYQVNLSHVKCIAREVINESVSQAPEVQQSEQEI